MAQLLEELLGLSHRMGDPNLGLAILAEGNVSVRADENSFLVKASGKSLGSLKPQDVSKVDLSSISLALHEELDDKAVRSRLESSTLDKGPLPSVETFMHGYLLKIPEVNWVIHTHPEALLGVLCNPSAPTWATWRLFPDHVVCCGVADCFVPYIDPGLPLAKAIKAATEAFVYQHGRPPKCYWLANHGLISLGRTSLEAESATLMAVKAAEGLQRALLLTKKPVMLTKEQISRIATRPDEHFRQAQLWLP